MKACFLNKSQSIKLFYKKVRGYLMLKYKKVRGFLTLNYKKVRGFYLILVAVPQSGTTRKSQKKEGAP